MKKSIILFASFIMLATLASCNKETAAPDNSHDIVADKTLIEFKALNDAGEDFNPSVQTKATAAVTTLSSFNVTATTGTPGSTTAGTLEKAAFSSAAFTGTSSFTGSKYWPATDPSYHFYAANATIAGTDGTASAAGAYTVAATNTTDIVCAYLASPTYGSSNALTFNHIFARVGYCKITESNGYTVSGLTCKITPKTGGTYNIRTGAGEAAGGYAGTGWSNTTTGAAVTLCSATGSTTDNGLYLVPGTYTLTTTFTLSRGDFSKSYTKTNSVNIQKGKINNITGTINVDDAADMTFTVSVAEWGTNAIAVTIS